MTTTPPSPYLHFTRSQWQTFRANTPLTLTATDVLKLHGQIEAISLKEVEEIYLPLSCLLSLYVTATQGLHRASSEFIGNTPKVPYIIGIAGSVAVGKSTTSRVLQALLSRWPKHRQVDIITTDAFLYPNAELEERNLIDRKGFPESFDLRHLIKALTAIKSGKHNVHIPIYSHHQYDILPNRHTVINQPDIVVLEGLNILQACYRSGIDNTAPTFLSDYLDFSLFVDTETEIVEDWYIERLLSFSKTAFKDKNSYFHHLSFMHQEEVIKFGRRIWREINLVNLQDNILPYKERARCILKKSYNHEVSEVWLKRL